MAEGDLGSRLLDAATRGDIEFLRKFYDYNWREEPSLWFLNYSDSNNRNILHLAVEGDRYTFLFEALNILSSNPTLVIQLICQKAYHSVGNPLHCAAQHGNIFILQLLVNAYTKAVSGAVNYQETPPWLARDPVFTPLRHSFLNSMPTQENIARYLVSVDEHFYRTLGQSRYPMDECSTQMLDNENISIVFIGMQRGFSLLVKQILTSDLPYALSGLNGETPLHYASKCNEQVSRILLEKHPELIRSVSSFGKTMLDHAVEEDTTWLVRLMLIEKEDTWTKACRKLIWNINKNGDTPLHIAARNGNIEILELLIQGYKSALEEETKYCEEADALSEPGNDVLGVNLFHVGNFEDDIPLILALRNKDDDCGLILSNETFPSTPGSTFTSIYKKSLPIAVQNGCLLSTKKILERVILSTRISSELSFRLTQLDIHSPIALGIAGHIARTYPVIQEMVKADEFEKFLEVLPRFLGENQKDSETILTEAVERGEDWFVRLALQSNKDLVKESAPAWQLACEKGNVPFLLIFIELCDHNTFIQFCRKTKQTPLHHIKLLQYEQYIELLNIPVFEKLVNQGDIDGKTPLHQAIARHDLELTKALLAFHNINIKFEDNFGKTAFVLLEEMTDSSTSWREQYIEVLKMQKFQELLNERDNRGMTPLLRAIGRTNLELTKALLTFDGIEITIGDNSSTTAFELLQKFVYLSPSWREQYIKVLKMSKFRELLNERDNYGWTPLHRALILTNHELTKDLLTLYNIKITIEDNEGTTAFDLLEKMITFSPSWFEQYIEVLKMQKFRKLLNERDNHGTTPLYRAIKGCNFELTKALLTFDDIKITIEDDNGTTAFDLLEKTVSVSPCWLEQYIEVLKMQKFRGLLNEGDNYGMTPLHRAIKCRNLEMTTALLTFDDIEITIKDDHGRTAFDFLGKTVNVSPGWREQYIEVLKMQKFRKLLNERDKHGTTPLYRAINCCNFELTKALLTFDDIEIIIKDDKGTTAFDLLEKTVNVSPCWLEQYIEVLKMPKFRKLLNERDNYGMTPLHRAIEWSDFEMTKALLTFDDIEITIKDDYGRTAFEFLGKTVNVSPSWREKYIEVLKMWKFRELLNKCDNYGATPLHRAIQCCSFEVTKALLTFDDIEITIKDDHGKTAFDLLEKTVNISPSWLEQYIELLKKPVFEKLVNQRDKDGTTPLHRAIQGDNLEVTKVLLETKGVDVTIKDNYDRTALDLLQKSCGLSPSWGKMCRDIKQDSTVKKLKYLFRKIAFEGMQNTISVVAALVATITFAAGFTVPGGTNSNDGTPMLATKAAFLAFSVSNTIAMCCSIMVLFILLGPMMWDPHPSLFYVNLSLSLLLMSLVGTIVAFMTGVYATMATKAKWNSIFVIVSCSLALIMACIVLLLTYSRRCRELVDKLTNWRKNISRNTTTQAAQSPLVATANSSQEPETRSKTLVAQASPSPLSEHVAPNLEGEVGQSSSTSHPTPNDLLLTYSPRSRELHDKLINWHKNISRNTTTQAAQSPSNFSQESETRSNTLVAQASPSLLSEHVTPNDFKIVIKQS